jgi:hypothetical protein
MSQIDFASSLFDGQFNLASLIKKIDGLLNSEKHTLTVIPYASAKLPADHLQGCLQHRILSHVQTYDGVSTFELTFYPPKVNEDPPLNGRFFITRIPTLQDTYLLLTVEPQEYVNRALLPFIERNRPTIYLTLLDQNRIKFLLNEFKIKSRYDDMKVIRVSWKSRLESDDIRMSSITWANLGLEGAFDFAREQNGWFKSLNLEVQNGFRLLAEFSITRDGIIKTNREFNNLYNNLILPVCDSVQQGFDLLKNRARSSSPSLRARPLTLDFGSDIFKSTSDLHNLSDSIRTMDKASVSLMHNNPYLQLSVVDYIDGSTFDLWVVNQREMTIVPQIKATVPGIRRLINHIFQSYAEGQVKEFQNTDDYATKSK